MASLSSSCFLHFTTILALVSWQALASDPGPLQDFCVADNNSRVLVNGFVCKDPKAVTAEDFFVAAKLDMPRDTKMSKVGSNVTLINVMKIAGLNMLGISLARIDYAPLGENPPHTQTLVPLRSSPFLRFNPNPYKPAVAIAALSSQNPGAITIAKAVFGSKPMISDDVLAKAFQVEKKTVDWLQAQFLADNHN
uniref:Germin-like protein n=1 Tax=Triticum aestivum TaxID=4565 RepID=A0A0B4SVG6_WHEAT|nr:germin-like protein [Triticum aestivum]